jgi:hypothetical protein
MYQLPNKLTSSGHGGPENRVWTSLILASTFFANLLVTYRKEEPLAEPFYELTYDTIQATAVHSEVPY